jgi:hypothetical protein
VNTETLDLEDLKSAREKVTAERFGYGFYLPEVQQLLRAVDRFTTVFSDEQQDSGNDD